MNPLWIIFLCAVGSILASPFYGYAIPYTRLLQLFTPIALFAFVSNAFAENERYTITHILLITLVTAGLCQTVIAIAQYFHQAPLGLRLFGEFPHHATIFVNDGTRWLIDSLLHRKGSCDILRATGTFPHPNVFGGFMVVSIMATYALILQTIPKQWPLLLTLPFQFFAMSLSYSRSALFAWGIATCIWFGFMKLHNRTTRRIAAALLISVILTGPLLSNQYLCRGGVVNYPSSARDSDEIRLFHQKIALRIIQDHPLLGLGFSQFSERALPYFPENTPATIQVTATHNIFLFLACETGLISAASLLFFIASLLRSFFKSPMTLEAATFASLLIGLIFIGCCDFYLILFQQGKLMFFFTAALLAIHIRKEVYNPVPL